MLLFYFQTFYCNLNYRLDSDLSGLGIRTWDLKALTEKGILVCLSESKMIDKFIGTQWLGLIISSICLINLTKLTNKYQLGHGGSFSSRVTKMKEFLIEKLPQRFRRNESKGKPQNGNRYKVKFSRFIFRKPDSRSKLSKRINKK